MLHCMCRDMLLQRVGAILSNISGDLEAFGMPLVTLCRANSSLLSMKKRRSGGLIWCQNKDPGFYFRQNYTFVMSAWHGLRRCQCSLLCSYFYMTAAGFRSVCTFKLVEVNSWTGCGSPNYFSVCTHNIGDEDGAWTPTTYTFSCITGQASGTVDSYEVVWNLSRSSQTGECERPATESTSRALPRYRGTA